jgi:branched-chain amino acid transport system permease protein
MTRFLVVGIINGAVYALLALGLVLVYKGSRVFNFAQAEYGTLTTYLAWYLIDKGGLPWPIGALLALLSIAAIGFLVERLVVRPLFDAPRVTLLVATAGVALLSIQVQLLLTGPTPQGLSAPISGIGVSVLGVRVTPAQLLTFVVLAGLGVGMAYFFSRTDLGLAVLATSQEPVATELAGIGTRRMSAFIWTLAAVLGGIAGILVAGGTSFTPAYMTRGFLLPSFTAAVVGGITSLPGAFVGGLVIGLAQSLGSYFLEGAPVLGDVPGVANVFIFVLLLTVLIVRPKGLLGTEA